ncbi:glycosyltransferase family 59 protein [Suillus plorans]|uniref:Dol-P-Glc:Glc(2)Man(9)GlcNAc(2)-PP-Dol alpha-1,2-glucosyltransferase n=1 Tax=Suillus plorans TaxID=116603 RepID=A0A9P7AET4_9AGAM|nr:glycosyltransferase family 59 protein [Suillus plorans]KAG1787833.1 glycosyltransferase family 59 protein [Suillus plorans]
MSSDRRILYVVYCGVAVAVLKEFNAVVTEPYMDEPFHVPQALAYCRGEWSTWDPKITTPPGLYMLSVLLHRVFMFKCNLNLLRLTNTLTLFALPLVLTRLLGFHQRRRSPPKLTPSIEALVLSSFPIAWFFGFLYYTEVPSLVSVLCTVVAATQNKHWLAGLLGIVSCFFRQNNVIWVLYAYAASQLMRLRFKRGNDKLHDPPALGAGPGDFIRSIMSAPKALPELLPAFAPYAVVLALFGGFVIWNDGIVLGDKSNHIPSFHVPQLYYFIAFATIIGWPAVLCGEGGPLKITTGVISRMRTLMTAIISIFMGITIQHFTIHHPFLLSDNRHFTFYIWRRVFMLHAAVPYLFIPGYQACAWAWWIRVACDQSLLQTLVLPVLILPTLLPTPLLEPRYFLVPYILLRAQVVDVQPYGIFVEGLWYMVINVATTYVFLYKERVGVGRFMW